MKILEVLLAKSIVVHFPIADHQYDYCFAHHNYTHIDRWSSVAQFLARLIWEPKVPTTRTEQFPSSLLVFAAKNNHC